MQGGGFLSVFYDGEDGAVLPGNAEHRQMNRTRFIALCAIIIADIVSIHLGLVWIGAGFAIVHPDNGTGAVRQHQFADGFFSLRGKIRKHPDACNGIAAGHGQPVDGYSNHQIAVHQLIADPDLKKHLFFLFHITGVGLVPFQILFGIPHVFQ